MSRVFCLWISHHSPSSSSTVSSSVLSFCQLTESIQVLRSRPSNAFANVRRYATRRPERPPQKIKDPLLASPNVDIQQLPEGLTFIHRPPPTKESVFSTTALPASPLLRPSVSQPSTSSSERTVHVPPRMKRSREFPTNRVLEEADFEEMRRLRNEDPSLYTRGKLAKMFNCPPFLVAQQVPLAAADKRAAVQKLALEHAEIREQWGERKSLFVAARKRRRDFW